MSFMVAPVLLIRFWEWYNVKSAKRFGTRKVHAFSSLNMCVSLWRGKVVLNEELVLRAESLGGISCTYITAG